MTNALLDIDELTNIFLVDSIKGFGPQKFKVLFEEGISLGDVLSRPREMQRFGKRGQEFIQQIEAMGSNGRQIAHERARKQLDAARATGGAILSYSSPFYPQTLFESNLPVPALYARGDLTALKSTRSVACVGSRNIRAPYDRLHDAFSRLAVSEGFAIVSGFATGADIIGHLAAEDAKGGTICVMPSGLDRPFPPEHRDIWRRFVDQSGAAFVSEFGFGVGANALNLRKRNKMISGMALGVLVSQSAEDGGAMNAYRFAMEQKRPVATFEGDGTKETSGNDLIAGSAEWVKASVLPIRECQAWSTWLLSL